MPRWGINKMITVTDTDSGNHLYYRIRVNIYAHIGPFVFHHSWAPHKPKISICNKNFATLRLQVKFGKKSSRTPFPDQSDFFQFQQHVVGLAFQPLFGSRTFMSALELWQLSLSGPGGFEGIGPTFLPPPETSTTTTTTTTTTFFD